MAGNRVFDGLGGGVGCGGMTERWTPEKLGPEYVEYHWKCVDACVALMGEQTRKFFENCSYEQDFVKGIYPEEVAEAQRESL